MISKLFQQLTNSGDTSKVESITGMDATFLYTETPTSPMHVGSVNIIEGSLEFETFKKLLHSKIHLIPKLRKRLVYAPMGVDYPYWVDDPNFDIDLHVKHVALPKPGDWKQLRKMASTVFSNPLDRTRPLWSITFVEGLDKIAQVPKGSVAIISKIHHVLIDGVAGKEIMSLIYSPSPKVTEIPEPKPYRPEPLPNELAMMLKSSMSFVENPLKLPRLIGDAVATTFKASVTSRLQFKKMPSAPFSAPPSPLNGIISPKRRWNTAILSLERVKALKNIMEVTLNDVMLAICAGALRRYLLEKDKLPKKPLVAMVPISTRTKEEMNGTGNQISSMLIQLGTTIEDPIERLETIHENTIRGKTYHEALGAKTLAQMAEAVPFGIANQASRIYSRFQMSELHNPVFNVTITNVPGPPIPLYLNGHKMSNVMGMAPIIDGMGLIITILSYNGNITVSPTSDDKTMPDLNTFTRYIRESANELEKLVLERGKSPKPKKKKAPVAPATPESDKIFEHFKTHLKANAEHIKPGKGIFQFHLTESGNNWKLDLNKSPAQVRKSGASNPDAVFTISDTHLVKIAKGQLGLQTAFIQGRLKIKGDSAKAMKMGAIISKLPPFEG